MSAGAISSPSRVIELPDEIDTDDPALTVYIWLNRNGQTKSPTKESTCVFIA